MLSSNAPLRERREKNEVKRFDKKYRQMSFTYALALPDDIPQGLLIDRQRPHINVFILCSHKLFG